MSLWSQLKSRLGLPALLDHMIPKHANSPAYVLGGTVVVLGIVQGVTGVLVQQFYHPAEDAGAAYRSVQYIASVSLWNFVRNLHYWGAQLILVTVILHMVRVYISAAYKKPREFLWFSGVALLVVAWFLSFSGSVLKWDQEAVEALSHNLELTSYIGPLGYWFSPTFAPDVPLLIRLNSAHVTILPIIAVLVVGFHVYLIRTQGISNPKTGTPHAAMVPFSTHVTRMILYGLIALGLTIVLAFVVQAPLSSLGNINIEVSKPDWYLLWVYSVENFWGLQVVPYILTPALILILIAPVLDRGPETDPRKRKLMMALLVIAVLLFVGLTASAALAPPQSHLG